MRIILFLILFPLFLSAQTVRISQVTFSTVNSDLKTKVGTDSVRVDVMGLSTPGDFNGGQYMWVASSTTADNGFTVIRPNQINSGSPGRWHRVANANTIKNSTTFSGAALQTAYVVNHGLPFTPAMVIVQPRSANAAVPSWVSNINATSFTVNFASVPVLGTNNLSIDYIIIKQ